MQRLRNTVGAVCTLMVGTLLAADGLTYHVDSRRGDDAGDGSEMRPFRHANRARDAIRALKREGRLPAGGVRV